ncbi:hypothetical protein Trydic_g5563 [Trypoxylus dichotomus]
MAKNKITTPERSHKKDRFFKKPKQTQVQNQSKTNEPKISESESHTSHNSFNKNTYRTKEIATTKKENAKEDTFKKPFDKKKWRLQRYSKKYKLQQWQETRKKAILKEYYKQTKENATTNFNVQKIYEAAEQGDSNSPKEDEVENENNLNSEITNDVSDSNPQLPSRKQKKIHLNAYQEYQRLKEDKIKRREEIRKNREERDKALKEYKKEKTRKFKRLNKKTSRGQPVMKYRMQMLLEQIQQSILK